MAGLPLEFKERMKSLLGGEYGDFEASFESESAVRALRVNTNKITVENFFSVCDFPLAPLPYCPEGFTFAYEHIGSHPLHHAGAFYVQEPGAMAPIECVPIKTDMKILDICASPGGKSTQAAAKLGGSGILVSNEIDGKRASVLASNIERLGLRNAVVTSVDSYVLRDTYPETFDLVIVDAPCSGEGMMRKNQLAISEWSIENIKMCAERQHMILENAFHTVAPGGYLLYATCTFAPEENEEQVDRFLAEHPDFELCDVPKKIKDVTRDGVIPPGSDNKSLTLCRRFYPHVSAGEGQFMALMRRNSCGYITDIKPEKKSKQKKAEQTKGKNDSGSISDENTVQSFLAEVLTDEGLSETKKCCLVRFGDMFFLCPEIQLPDAGVKSAGVPVGIVRKGRVVPEHHFFMAYGKFFRHKIELPCRSEDAVHFLHGDTLVANAENGFAAVFIGTCTVGGAKVSNGEAKNYYPKGLRE